MKLLFNNRASIKYYLPIPKRMQIKGDNPTIDTQHTYTLKHA